MTSASKESAHEKVESIRKMNAERGRRKEESCCMMLLSI